jgi:hypothetical protein
LNQLAWAAVRTKGSYFQDLFRRLVVRKGPKVAIWAVAHRMLRVIWKVLHQKVRYVEHGPRSGNPQALQKRKRRLLYEFRRLGYSVQLSPLQGPASAEL